ncbi:MAG: DUF3810 domain-containing protein [Oscillibacter sp.]|nr:DUF3810 domain-containing protein [Oscillibacter sp.]
MNKPAVPDVTEYPPEKKKRKLFGPLRFFFQHWFVHLWLLLDLAGLGYYFYYRDDREKMNALAENYTRPIQAKLGQWSSQISFSVMEVLAVALAFLVIAFLFWSLISVLADKGRRLHRLYSNLMTAVCFAGFLAAAGLLLWGTNFRTDNFQDKSGLRAQPVSAENLKTVTTYFARALSYVSTSVDRDAAGRFAVPRETILAEAPEVYDNAETSFPCLAFDDVGVKPMTFSRLMSAMDFTGFYCSYTGEANVNVDSLACLLPSTCAHEMAHQRGFASEQECNFLAVLACVTSGKPDYVYSGYLMGYIYLGNALYAADPDAYWSIRQRLPENVVSDLSQNNTYWDQFRGTKIQEVSNEVYDKLLKTYGDERGMQSYGDMVDLLVAYWLPALQATGEAGVETAQEAGVETAETAA